MSNKINPPYIMPQVIFLNALSELPVSGVCQDLMEKWCHISTTFVHTLDLDLSVNCLGPKNNFIPRGPLKFGVSFASDPSVNPPLFPSKENL